MIIISDQRGGKVVMVNFLSFIDVSKVNAWKIYRTCVYSNGSLLDFQRSLVISLLETPFESDNNEKIQNTAGKFQNPAHSPTFQNLLLKK